jgi:hypothetical protein
MKNLIFLIVVLFAFNAANAQHQLTLSWDGEPIEESITVFGDQFDAEIVAHAIVTNNTTQDLNIMVRRNQIEMQEGTMSQFCWGLCYPPDVNESAQYLVIKAGQSSEEEAFSGHYIPSGIWGASIVEYEFYDMNDENTNVKVTVVYSATLSGFEDKKEVTFSMYPNPAMSQLTVESEDPIQHLSIFDLTGKSVYDSDFERSNVDINVEFLDSGIYLVRLQTKSGSVVKKLSVR